MATIKFSAFTAETDPANIDFLVGYEGTTMKKIDPANIGGGGLTPYAIPTGKNAIYAGFVPTSVTGSQNVVLSGGDTGTNLTTGQDNILIGYRAGVAITTSLNNVCIGTRAGQGLTTIGSGFGNTIIGAEAGGNTSSGATAIGWLAGNRSNTVSVGDQAGRSASGSASLSVHIGSNAGYSNSGSTSIMIGGSAARNNSTNGHTSIGYNAGYSQTSGTNNTNLGYQAGYAVTTGQFNTFVGDSTGKNATGSSNVFMGYQSGSGAGGAMSGIGNVGVGVNVMKNITSGNGNVGVGNNALEIVASGTGGNVGVGQYAGSGISTGSGYTVVGQYAGNSATYTGSNVTLIGYDAEASSATASNEITLGNSAVTSFRIPGLQSGASNGDVLTFNSSAGKLELQAAGGGGASDLNGLTDCLVDTDSLYVGEVPSGLSGNPQANTILGIDAGKSLTSGANNTLIGNLAGGNFTGGTAVFVGPLAGEGTGTSNSTGNVAMGWSALRAIQSGNNNVSIGFQTGRSIGNAASSNTMLGALAGYSNTGSYTVMIGRNAGRNNTSSGLVSVGSDAGYSNTSGSANTNLGYQAGYSNTTNGENVNVGYNAGKTATGSQNVAVGRNAFGDGFGHSGISNVAMGFSALSSPSGASNYNVAIGSEALKGDGTKSNNVAVGYKAGLAITTGSNNVALGYQSLYSETSGQRNTAIGYEALKNQNQQFAAHNTAVGWQADDSNTAGYYRTNIGATTGGTSTGSNITNIGFGAQESSSTVSNEVTLGNSSVATLRCAVTSITSLSDERDKSEIKDLGYGLAFIDALQPREFVWNNRPETNKDGEEFYSSNKGKKDFGFIAQEVKELDNDTLRLVYDENPDKLELSYGKLVPVLVQAIKELKEEIELLKSQNK